MGNVLALACAAALICGCAATPPGTPGTGSGAGYAPMVDMQGVDADALAADVNICRTEASNVRVMRIKGEADDMTDMLVLGVGIVVPFGLVGMAVISGVMGGLSDDGPRPADAALQQRTLVHCMARKGYRNLDPNVKVAYVAPAKAQSTAALPGGGRDTYMAERYAQSKLCQGAPATAVLQGKGPGFERYAVACAGERARSLLRCEFGNCAPEETGESRELEVALGR